MPRTRFLLPLVTLAVVAVAPMCAGAAEISVEAAWKALPKYEPGQDMGALLRIDREIIGAMESTRKRSACAAKLAGLLTEDGTTMAARQWICLKLRQVGTAAEVPLLEKLLEDPPTAQMARSALESIPGPRATAALRAALMTSRGERLLGVIGSVAKRKDMATVARLKQLADSADQQVATAAIRALGNITDGTSLDFLIDRAEKGGAPTTQVLVIALLRYAAADQHAEEIYAFLSQPDQPATTRRAALAGLLRLQGEEAEATVLQWFSCPDVDRRRIAAGHLQRLSDDQLDKLLGRLVELPDTGKLAVVEVSASRRGARMLPAVMSLVESSNPDLKEAGIRCLGMIGDASAIPALVDMLAIGGEATAAARQALAELPRKEVAAALLAALGGRPALRIPVIDVLVDLKCYDAIDPLVEIAANPDPAEYAPALDGLRGIADPDKTDIPRLVRLLLASRPGYHRDEVEKTILIVCEKLPAGADRSELVLVSLNKLPPSAAPVYLPALGRLGGPKALEKIQTALESPDAAVEEAAVRALCNWPNAAVADKLLELAKTSKNREFKRWALRGYIRVASLKSERPEAQTLAMLQNAFELAAGPDEKRLVLERTATVRTMAAVTWIARFLDDPELAQAASGAIVELAHHRFLRHPNMERFGPILEQVGRVSQDPDVTERAKRYRLGL